MIWEASKSMYSTWAVGTNYFRKDQRISHFIFVPFTPQIHCKYVDQIFFFYQHNLQNLFIQTDTGGKELLT